MLNIKSEIEENSPEWHKIDYKLQLTLGLPAANPIKIYKFNNSQTNLNQMKEAHPNKTILQSYLNVGSMEQQKLKKIFHKKIRMDELEFQTGHLQVDVVQERDKKFALWFLKIVVGDSYCIPQNQRNNQLIIPPNYDSIYLVNKKQIEQLYRHNYKVKDSSQYVIEYEVVFDLEKKKEFNPRAELCNKCEKRSAGIYCRQEEAFFCSECNILHHKQKLLSNHSRQEINKFNTMPMCNQPQHNRRLQLYCFDCRSFLCLQCTMIGSHSNNQMNKHNIKQLKKWYQQKNNLNNELSKTRKQELSISLKKIDEIMKQVQQHSSNIQKKIIQMYQKSLKQLKKLTREKIDSLLTIQIETKRQYDQCVWTDSFIRYQQQILRPIYYISIQQQYQAVKKEYSKFKITKDFAQIKPYNIEISGQIRIYLRKKIEDEIQIQNLQLNLKKKKNLTSSNNKLFVNNYQNQKNSQKKSDRIMKNQIQNQQQQYIFKSPDQIKKNSQNLKNVEEFRQIEENQNNIFRPKTTTKRSEKLSFDVESKSKMNSQFGDKKKGARSILETSLKKNGFTLT